MSLLSSRKQALAAITEPAPENTMVVIKPDGKGSADVRYTDAVKAHKHYVDICTGDEYIQNEFGYYEGFRNNSNVIEKESSRTKCLFAQSTLERMSPEEKAEIIQKLVSDEFPELGGDPHSAMSPESIDSYEEICAWAASNNVSSAQVLAFWGPIRREMGCTEAGFSVLRNKVMQLVLERAETARKEVFGTSARSVENSLVPAGSIALSVQETPKIVSNESPSPEKSSPAATPSQSLQARPTTPAAPAVGTAIVTANPASTPASNAVAGQQILIDTETGEIEMPREEFLYLLRLQDSQLDNFNSTELENVDKLLAACCALQADCFKIAKLATAAINHNLSLMAGLLYKYGGGLREFSLPLLKKGTKTWKSPNLTGSVHYKKTGGFRCVDRTALRDWADKLSEKDFDACPFVKADIVIDLRLANKWQKEHPEKLLPGFEIVPIHEYGIMQVGDGKPFSLPKLRTELKSIKISNLTSYLGSDDDDDNEDE